MSTEMFTAKQVYELISAGMIRSAVKLHEERTKNEQQALVIQQLKNDLAATEGGARQRVIHLESENRAMREAIRDLEKQHAVDLARISNQEAFNHAAVDRFNVSEREKLRIIEERDEWAKRCRQAQKLHDTYGVVIGAANEKGAK